MLRGANNIQVSHEITAIISAGLVGASFGVNQAMQNENSDTSFAIGMGALGFAVGSSCAALIDCGLAFLGFMGSDAPLYKETSTE